MVQKTLILGFLLSLSAVELAVAKFDMNNSVCISEDRRNESSVRNLKNTHQDIDEYSDEEEDFKGKKIAAKVSVKTETSEDYFSWIIRTIKSTFKSIFGY